MARQILHGCLEYLSSIENVIDFNMFGTPGIALGDVNGDGLDDIYLCQERGLPNRLFIQNSDGAATDISVDAGMGWLESFRSALLLDLDNDGDQHLYVANDYGLDNLYRNDTSLREVKPDSQMWLNRQPSKTVQGAWRFVGEITIVMD